MNNETKDLQRPPCFHWNAAHEWANDPRGVVVGLSAISEQLDYLFDLLEAREARKP